MKKAVEPFEILDASEMMATVPEKLPCLVEDLLLDVSVSQLSAKPKTGKSSLARQLAVAMAEGYPFLGHVVTRGNVLYVNTEGPGWVVAAHFKKLGYTGQHSKIKVVSQRMPNVNAEGLAKLELALTALPYSLVVIDTAAKFMRAFDSNNYDLMGLAMEELEDRAKKFKTHIMLLFHNKNRVEADHRRQHNGQRRVSRWYRYEPVFNQTREHSHTFGRVSRRPNSARANVAKFQRSHW